MQGIQGSTGGGNRPGDVINLGQLSYSRGHRYKNINYAYGADIFAGAFYNRSLGKSDPNYFKSKSVQGYELKSSINVFHSYRTREFRYLGLDLAYSKENGDFAKFRQVMPTTKYVYIIPATGLFSAAINSEMVWTEPFWKITRYSLRFSLKQTFGDLRYNEMGNDSYSRNSITGLTASAAGYAEIKNIFFIMEAGAGGRINIGYKF